MQDFEVLARTAASQHGLLSRKQLRDGGMSASRIDRLLAVGSLSTVRRGVVAIGGAPESWERNVLAVLISIGGLAVASHRSALRLWGLREVDEEIEVTIPDHRMATAAGAAIHRSVDLQAEHRTVLDGVPVTTIERTLVDAGLIFPEREVRRLVARALVVKVTTRSRLWEIRRRLGRQGRNGVIALEQALETLPDEAGAESDPELELRAILCRPGIDEPVAQHLVVLGGSTYRLDLSYPSRRVALEYDGFDAHMSIDAFERERARQNDLVLAGWFVLRYTRVELRRPEHIVRQVRAALARVS
jgi:hypothetical protein